VLERDKYYKFHFDGQVMPILDFLEDLKERDGLDNKGREKEAEQKIRKFVKRGQLSLGPCWSSPETSLISFESLIRNINRGIRFAKKFGPVSTVFYNADAFQYHSQVPQIIAGTGLKAAFTWRAHKEGKPLTDLSLWKGADQTAIIKYYPARSYAQTWHLPENLLEALEVIKSEADSMRHFAVTNHVLITQGNDQFEAQADVNDMIHEINKLIGEKYKVAQITLKDFFEIIEKENPKLNVLQGELTGNKWACTMSGQLSARIYLKQKNKEAEIAIEKWAEPLAAFSWLLGYDYPAGVIERAWEYLMKQHFHLCNACAIDEVHREGEVRYRSAIELARDVVDLSLENIVSKIDNSALVREGEKALVVFNPSDVERSEVITIQINTGPQALKDTEWQVTQTNEEGKPAETGNLLVRDDQGKGIPHQLLGRGEETDEIVFWADKIPPFGYRVFGLSLSQDPEFAGLEDIARPEKAELENRFLKLKIEENGSFTIWDKRNGAVFKNQNIIEDVADHGDTYNFDPLPGDRPITTRGAKGKVVITKNGPFLATCEVKTELALPEGLTDGRDARAKKVIKVPIVFNITLKKDSPLVYITAEIDNQVKDHRLRAVFQGVKSDLVYVQTQGDVVRRRLKDFKAYPPSGKRAIAHQTSIGDLPKEIGPSPTQFQRNFVGMNDGEKGLVVFNKGLPEYEARSDGTIALTLLRCIGWLSQDDLSFRDKLAGPKLPVPDAQCIGRHTFEYALLTQPGSWKATPVYREENQYSIPVKFLEIPRQKGPLPTSMSFVTVRPDGLMVSAIKKAYKDNDLVIRLFNPTRVYLDGQVGIFPGINQAWLTDMNEGKKELLSVNSDGTISIKVKPKKIITIRISPRKWIDEFPASEPS